MLSDFSVVHHVAGGVLLHEAHAIRRSPTVCMHFTIDGTDTWLKGEVSVYWKEGKHDSSILVCG